MDELDFPILKKLYTLYKELHDLRAHVAKLDRYTLWERCENMTLDVLELLMIAVQRQKPDKYKALELASAKLNVLRVLIRLAKDTKTIDAKKYISLETLIDEVGRMLGGWIKSLVVRPPPNNWSCIFPEQKTGVPCGAPVFDLRRDFGRKPEDEP